jgi:xylulokinase
MGGRVFVGVDIGSSAVKALAVREDGRVVATVRRPHRIDHPRPGRAEMDAERVWWGGTVEAVRALLERPGVEARAVGGIGVCCIGASVVPLGARGRALRPGILYGIDSRAGAQIERLNRELGEARLLAATGRRLSSQSVGPKIAWLRETEPAIWARTRRLVTPAALVTGRLCGREAVDPHTALTFDPLYDPATGRWDPAMRERLLGEVGPTLPEIVPPGERLGSLTAGAAAHLGLPAGVPVAGGTADVLAEAVGAGVRRVGDLMVMYGSTLFLVQRVRRFGPSPPLWPSVYLDADQPTLLGGTSNAGSLLAWFDRELADGRGLDTLLAQAGRIAPGSDGLLCLPYFEGERAPIFDPLARGMFVGLTPRHTRAHLLRALLEGIGFGFRHLLESFVQAGQSPRRLFATGGGTNVPLWTQIMSDVSGHAQQVRGLPEGAALGAAYLGALAAGAFDRGRPLPRGWVETRRPVTPRAAAQREYDRLYPMFLEAYRCAATTMHRLAGPAS